MSPEERTLDVGKPDGPSRVGDVIADRYELVEILARGGMGTVWIGQDRKLGRKVALKIMRPESLEAFPDARERFEMEARAVAALRSSHVVQVHDYGVDGGTPYIAMELLEGESLKDRLAARGALGVEETSQLLWQVAKGLKAAHGAGLVHRDLKPSNIFLTHRDDVEVAKLLDFGVVKSAARRGPEQTASGVLLGTPQYMSPEQARGLRKVDHRADLWSLAVILYTALVGDNPFDSEAEAVGDIVIRVCIEPIPAPSVIKPDLPVGLDAFFDKALARDPDERFQSAEALAEAFMLAADLSFAGLDERSLDGSSGPGYSGPHRRPSFAGSTPPPGAVAPAPPEAPLVDDPSSSGTSASMSTSIEALAPRRRVMLAAAGGLAAGGALLLYALRAEPGAAPLQPSMRALIPAVTAPAPPASTPAPPTATPPDTPASASPSATASARTLPSLPQIPVVLPKPRPTAEPSANSGGNEPQWYDDD